MLINELIHPLPGFSLEQRLLRCCSDSCGAVENNRVICKYVPFPPSFLCPCAIEPNHCISPNVEGTGSSCLSLTDLFHVLSSHGN